MTRLLSELFPAMGKQTVLLSLLLLQHARREARLDANGRLVPLEDQDRSLRVSGEIAVGNALLEKAQRIKHRGLYTIQASIAAVHARASSAEETD